MAKKKCVISSPRSGTIGELVEFLLGRPWRDEPGEGFLGWPPDAFGVAATLLRESGAYVKVVGQRPSLYGDLSSLAEYLQWTVKQGRLWARSLNPPSFKSIASAVALWRKVYRHRDRQLTDLGDVWTFLVPLCALADEASVWLAPIVGDQATGLNDLGMPGDEMDGADSADPVMPWRLTQWMLENVADDLVFSNLCSGSVSRSNLIVLPKTRTPQNGITIRSLSHSLALLPNREVHARWQLSQPDAPTRLQEGMNLLLFPWPMALHPVQFQPVAPAGQRLEKRFHSFKFSSDEDVEASPDRVERAYEVACRRFGRIDAVVFPEMALDVASFEKIRRLLARKDVVLVIGGVYDQRDGSELARNSARIGCFFGSDGEGGVRYFEREQHKHHRWMLEDSQIRTYGLGSMLNPQYDWWEHIELGKRTLEFTQMDRSLVVAVLICEDLARPDPVGDVIRAIGPNLVIALLQDGPQLAGRWSARYATVLADDPGCSVLTLTGLGMTQLSRPANIRSPSRVVALWKQADSAAREIELPVGADSLVLCLSRERRIQWTADGRKKIDAGHVTLSGIHAVNVV